MKLFLACIILVFITTACKPVAPATPIVTNTNQSTNGAGSSTPVGSQTPTLTAPPPTDTPPPTSLPASIPCDPSEKYCNEAGHFFLDRPISLPGVDTIDRGYPYGGTEGGQRDPHHGVEFYNASGTPVLACADGLVVVAGNDSQMMFGPRLNFYGNLIVLEHHFPDIPQPVYTLYGHLSKVEVRTGQMIRDGDKIGEVGATGEATGSHLHFEVRIGQDNYASNRNPVLWLKPLIRSDGASTGVIAGHLEEPSGKMLYTSDLNIQHFHDINQPQVTAYQVEDYAAEKQMPVRGDDLWNENFTLSDIPAGNYRISLVWGGKLYDHWVIVMPGKLTLVYFQIDK
jgi:hypothetical protein